MARAEKPKPKSKPGKKTQYGRFVETARKLGCDEREDVFESSFRKIIPPRRRAKES